MKMKKIENNKKKYRACFIVILYDKKIMDSQTILSLLESDINFRKIKLVIWNNGPSSVRDEIENIYNSLNCDVSIIDSLSNESLAKAYNYSICRYSSLRYVILDDDSCLNDTYLQNVFDSSINGLSLPLVKSKGVIVSPKVNGYIEKDSNIITKKTGFEAIASGMIIGENFASIIKNSYSNVFDERYYLYGVDTTFCMRIKNLELCDKVKVVHGFEHSLSRLEKESIEASQFRIYERSIDSGLTARIYKRNLIFSVFELIRITAITVLKVLLKKPRKLSLIDYYKAFISCKHPRSGAINDIEIYNKFLV